MENINVDLEEVLRDCDCHFTWNMESYDNPLHTATDGLQEEIEMYNHLAYNDNATRRFRNTLIISYKMYRRGQFGWDKLLENGLRIMENSRNPDYPPGLFKLPCITSPLYTGSTEDFFAYTEDETAYITEDADVHDSNFVEEDLEERMEDEEGSFTGMFVAAEHVFYSLKATMLLRIGSSSTEVLKLLTHVVHKDDMTPSDKAALLFFKAFTIRHWFQGDLRCFSTAMMILNAAIRLDPDNIRYLLCYIRYSGCKRRLLWGQRLDRSELESLIDVIDSVLMRELGPRMRKKYQFQKLQALDDMWRSSNQMTAQESRMIDRSIDELNEIILSTADDSKTLSFCSKILSKKDSSRAITLIEKALKLTPDCSYVNARACLVYKKAGNLAKALEFAEKAATISIGSCWQVFDLKIALREEFDYEQFFCNVLEKYPLDRDTKVTHRKAALFFMIQGEFYRALVHCKAILDKYGPDDDVYSETYYSFNNKYVLLAEAAYNVVSYVLNPACTIYDTERASLLDLCNTIKDAIEDKFDFDDFKHARRFNSEKYIEWLQGKQPCKSRQAEGRLLRSHNNDSTSSQSSNCQRRLENNWRVDNNRTASSDNPQGLARSSDNSGRSGFSRAENMAKYFGISAKTEVTRTTQPQSADSAYNWSNYNQQFRGRPKNSSVSNSNWRDRDNHK